jgi:Uncharacterised nucleotidyltransferase
VVGAGLVNGGRPHSIAVGSDRWQGILSELKWQRLTGLALRAAQEGALELDDDQFRDLVTAQRDLMIHALVLERNLLALWSRLQAAEVEAVVLKGSALANEVYPDPSWRPFGDIDLLVRKGEWLDALETLSSCGFQRRYREPRPGFTARFGHAALLTNNQNVEVDLHRTLVAGPFGMWIQPDELFDRTTDFVLGGIVLRRLDNTAALAHACVHASLGFRPPLLLPIRDVAQLCMSDDVDWEVMREWSRRWHLAVVFEHAFDIAANVLGTALPVGLEPVARHDRRDQRALRAYTSDRRRYGGKATGTVLAIPGFRAKFEYVGAMLFPDRAFLASRAKEGSAGSYLGRWLIPIRWVRKRSVSLMTAVQEWWMRNPMKAGRR